MEKTVSFFKTTLLLRILSVKESDGFGKKKEHQTRDVPLHSNSNKQIVSKAMHSPC